MFDVEHIYQLLQSNSNPIFTPDTQNKNMFIPTLILCVAIVSAQSRNCLAGTCSAVRKPLIAGNWKMNTDLTTAVDLSTSIAELTKSISSSEVEIAVFPPFPFIREVWNTLNGNNPQGIRVGAQNIYFEAKGAYTAAVSAAMVKSVGAEMVLVGHSERRSVFGETDADINRSVKQVLAHGLVPVLCIGETLEEYELGLNKEVIATQLSKGLVGVTAEQAAGIVIAYEPMWAIGTGKVATPEIAQYVHSTIRTWLRNAYGEDTCDKVRILYGGSVTPQSAPDLLKGEDVDGALVGGASLKADSFAQIVMAARA